jgi:hypothetical protein
VCLLCTCCFLSAASEPGEVIEPTVIAALNMTYPGCRLNVVVLLATFSCA